MSDVVSYELVDNIAVISVNNPPVNALSQAVREGILDAVTTAQGDASEAIVLHCEGRAFIAGAIAGVEPRVMGFGPVFAIRKALTRAGLELGEMDIIEINEAFAPQVLGCLKMLEVDFADSRVNPNGGAIAIGHPLGASGARLAITAMRQLERSKERYAVISLCIGIGQGIAAVLERVE